MARAAVLDLLRNDTELAALGSPAGWPALVIVPNFEADQRPSDGAFIVVCWRHTDFEESIQENAERHLELYFHVPTALSTDYGRIDNMIDRVDAIFAAVEDSPAGVVGGDGYRLNYMGFEGRGPDVTDPKYMTICRQAAYMALSCKVTA